MNSECDKQPRHRRITAPLLVMLALVCVSLACPAENRKVEKRVQPVYPELAKRMRIGGLVHISVTVAPDGNVTDAKALNGNKMLEVAAEEAVKKWKFVPSDVQSTVAIDINFEPSN
ncbi:MAG TPA: energy transducer TonB [Steroidobacteraceae bacterium]|nr:energy transducer TonB [Steroidobacteraceae bacterium]